MKQKTVKIKLTELFLMLYNENVITKNKLERINQFIANNNKKNLNSDLIKLNIDLSSALFGTVQPLNVIEITFTITDFANQINEEKQYKSIW